MSHPIVKHLILEIRYEPSLFFYTVMDKIGLVFEDKYPDWERSPLTLEIRNKKLRQRCFLSYQRSFFEAVEPHVDGVSEFEKASKFFERIHFELKFTQVKRLGIRQLVCVNSSESMNQLVKKVAKRFQPQSDALDRILRGKVEDVSYVANVQTDIGWKYHLRLGPMERKQWFELTPYELGIFETPEAFKKFQESIPETMLFIDLDCYKDDLAYSDVSNVIGSIRRTSTDLVSDLVKFLEG